MRGMTNRSTAQTVAPNSDKAARRRMLRCLSQFKRRANRTPAQTEEINNTEKLRKRKSRADETLAQTEERRKKNRECQQRRKQILKHCKDYRHKAWFDKTVM